ncbi:MAG: hypothetical protein KBF49_09450 [Flavobacteriales bacterium]|nr:hypothetical protein [Flavobacteriales bacterium]
MKEKITLSVDRAAKRKAEAYKKRMGISLSEIFEFGVAQLKLEKGPHPFEQLVGTLQFTKADAERDDRVGREVRKIRAHVPGVRRKSKRA